LAANGCGSNVCFSIRVDPCSSVVSSISSARSSVVSPNSQV
jgi:hypothetical protein